MYEYCEIEAYRDWSVKNILSVTVTGIKQIGLDNECTIPEAIQLCLTAYETEGDANE